MVLLDVPKSTYISSARSTQFFIAANSTPVPVGNLIWLAVDRESGDAVVQ
jgi:hypothetical protein